MLARLQKIIIPLVLFMLSLTIRLLLIGKGPYHSDSLGFAMNVEQSVLQHKMFFLHGHGYPLCAILGAGFFGLLRSLGLNDPVFAINLLSVLFSSGCVVLLYLLGRRLFDSVTALCAALLFSFTPIFLSVSVYGNSHTVSLFFFLAAMLGMTRAQKKQSSRLLYISAGLLGLAGAGRIQDLVVLLPAFIYFYWKLGTIAKRPSAAFSSRSLVRLPKRKPPRSLVEALHLDILQQSPFSIRANTLKWRDFLIATGITLATIILFYLPTFAGRVANNNAQFLKLSLLDPLSEWFPPYFLGQTGLYLTQTFHPLGIILIAAGLWLMARGQAVFLALWVLGPLLVFGNTFMTTPRWQTSGLVPLSLLLGYALSAILRGKDRRAKPLGLGLLLLLLTLSLTLIYPVLSLRHQQQISPEYARWIAAHTPENAVIIVGDDGPFIRYYGKRATLRQIVTDTDVFFYGKEPSSAVREYKQNLDQLLAAGTPVYISEIGLLTNNTGFFEQFLTHHYSLSPVGKTLFEAWHRSCIKTTLIPVRLFQIKTKTNP